FHLILIAPSHSTPGVAARSHPGVHPSARCTVLAPWRWRLWRRRPGEGLGDEGTGGVGTPLREGWMTWDEKRSRSGRGGREQRSTRGRRPRRAPFLRLLAYYAGAAGLAAVLTRSVPAVRNALVAPVVLPAVQEVPELARAPTGAALSPTPHRALTTALVILGTLALVLAVAWVYRYTRGLRTDRTLVQSMLVLPLVVAGIVIVVKNSLALAFSLAGIVAAVRFRNTLKDPRDAVYVFLALGLGLAAGVQALDIALVISLSFNL